jgi:hypothetical protein
MDTDANSSPRLTAARRRADQRHRQRADLRRESLLGGDTQGNERLTIITGLVLIVLLSAVGVTIVRIGQLLWLHLFLGLVVLGPVCLKLGSTGYRFLRYYRGDDSYRRKGPPAAVLRGFGSSYQPGLIDRPRAPLRLASRRESGTQTVRIG